MASAPFSTIAPESSSTSESLIFTHYNSRSSSFHPIIQDAKSPWRGFALEEVEQMAQAMKMNMIAVKAPNDWKELSVPCVVHWKQNHYAAIVKKSGKDEYVVRDLTFKFDGIVNVDAIREEASGYFLVNADAIPKGWRRVGKKEAWKVYGRGLITTATPDALTSNDTTSQQSSECHGMAGFVFYSMMVSLGIKDTPLGYVPPVGPTMNFSVHYNQRETAQLPSVNYGYLGKQWGYNWNAWVETGSLTARVVLRGGGAETFTRATGASNFDTPDPKSQARLVIIGTNAFERQLPDGSKEVFSTAQSLGGGQYRVFLSQVVDPSGNAVDLTYDGSYRLITITDAIGQNMVLSYGNGSYPYLITKVKDFADREATFTYNSSGQLVSVTDVAGITSSFTYDSGDFVTSLTTPYGTTQFSYSIDGTNQRILTATDPLGHTEKLEFNSNVSSLAIPGDQLPPSSINVGGSNVSFLTNTTYNHYRNSFYWDKKAYAADPDNRSNAVLYKSLRKFLR